LDIVVESCGGRTLLRFQVVIPIRSVQPEFPDGSCRSRLYNL
jgi:hypothetical protein